MSTAKGGNIAAGCSSDDEDEKDSEGFDNNQRERGKVAADKVDKKIIEIAV